MKLLFLLFFISPVFGAVDLRWLGGSSLLLSDGSSTLVFDPAFTRPTLSHWMGLSPFRSDESFVRKVLAASGSPKVDAVIVAHTHFDHVVDAPMLAHLSGAKLFGDKGVEIIAKVEGKKTDFQLLTAKTAVQIGNFRITPFERKHSPLLNLFDFLPGEVPKDFDFGFYDYKGGTNWLFLVEHPEGVILIDNSQEADLSWNQSPGKIDILIQGVTNSNNEIILKGYVEALKPRTFIPVHFDRFMLAYDLESKVAIHLPNIKMEKLQQLLKEKHPELKFILPEYREPVRLLP